MFQTVANRHMITFVAVPLRKHVMRIEYALTAQDWAAFGDYHARTAPQFRRAKNRILAGGILLVLGTSATLSSLADTIVCCSSVLYLPRCGLGTGRDTSWQTSARTWSGKIARV